MGLDYDNSAFYYFGMTMLGLYVVPSTLWVIHYFICAVSPVQHVGEEARTSLEMQKMQQLKKRRTPRKLLTDTKFLLILSFLVFGWVVLLVLVRAVAEDAELASFDPFKILSIHPTAEDKEIRKAYRKLSLQYHPDKNAGNKVAEEMFMKVAKAYEALTDEEARKNWLEYGNPDGKQSLEVSIGLPTFLLDTSNHYAILCVYLGVLVVIIPAIVAAWYQHSRKFGENNVMYETYSFFLHVLSEHSTIKMLPEVLAGAGENRAPELGNGAKRAEISQLIAQLRQGLMHKPRFEHPIVLKGNALIHAHLHRLNVSASLREDLLQLLANAPSLIEAMMEITQSQRWLQTSINVIDFSQYLTQALWMKDHSLAQLPHFGEKEISHCVKGKGAVRGLHEYLGVPDEYKKGLSAMTDLECADVLRVCKIMPMLQSKIKLYVEDEVEIAERDLVTVLIVFDRTNIPDGAIAPPVHAPRFPTARLETWWVCVSDRAENLILADKIHGQSKVVHHCVKFMAPSVAGSYMFNIDLKASDYLGLDIREQVNITVTPAAELPLYTAHPDDLNLDDEPTLFEQVMSANAETDSDTDADKDDAHNRANGDKDQRDDNLLTQAEHRRRQARIRRKQRKVDHAEPAQASLSSKTSI